MFGHRPPLDPSDLRRLRHVVQQMHRGNGRGVPMHELVRLAADVEPDLGLTIDFDASRQLGQPMVLLRAQASATPPEWWEDLSRREREVAALLAQGLSNKEIAAQLSISLGTVKDHVHQVLSKTGLPRRAAVAAAWPGAAHSGF